MNPATFLGIISRFGLTQRDAGKLLGYSVRSVNKWATGNAAIPPCVAILLTCIDTYQVDIKTVSAFSKIIQGESLT